MNVEFQIQSNAGTFTSAVDDIVHVYKWNYSNRENRWVVLVGNDDIGYQSGIVVSFRIEGTSTWHQLDSLLSTLADNGMFRLDGRTLSADAREYVPFVLGYVREHNIVDFSFNTVTFAYPANTAGLSGYLEGIHVTTETVDRVRELFNHRYGNQGDVDRLRAEVGILRVTISSMEADILRLQNDFQDFQDNIERRIQDLQRSS